MMDGLSDVIKSCSMYGYIMIYMYICMYLRIGY